ncbi:Helicase protein MOM1, partial [Striga hermonthica]
AEDNPSPSPTLDTRVLCSEIKRSEGMSGGRSVSSDEQTTPQSSLQEETKRLCRVLKFSKKIRKLRERLLRRHELELQEFHEKWNREKIKLEMDHKLESAFVRAVHGQSVIGIDRLKLLNTDFKMKMEELVSQKDLELKALEARQLEEINLVEAKAKAYLCGPGSVGELQSLAPQPEEHAGEDFQPCRQSDEAIGCETRVENPETVSAQNEDGGNVSQPKQTGDNEEAAFMNPAASVERVSDALVDERSRPDEVASEDSQGLKQQLVQSKENAPLTDCGNTLSQQVQQDKPNHSLAPAVENQTTLQNQTEPIDTVNPVLPNHEEAPVANEYVIHVPSDHETVTHEPTNNETVTREPAGAKTLTCEPTDNETETHVPKGTETLTCEPTNNETVTHVPKGTKTVIHEPTDNEIVTHEPMGTKTVTREPIDNETVAHVPTGTETVTHEPTGIETVTREPTDNETVAHVPTGTETVTHVPACIETVTREPTDNETVAHVPTGTEILTPVPSDHETAAQITSDHGTVAQLPSNPGQNAVVPAVYENCVTTPSQIVVSTAEWLNEAVFQLGSDASHSEEPNYLVHPSHQLAYGSSPPSSSIDPLQIEIDKLRKETEQLDKYHRELVLRLQYDCEKEIQDIINQIRNKYNTKLQEAETELKSKRNELDKNHNKVVMNKLLAAAFRSKCWNPKFALVP